MIGIIEIDEKDVSDDRHIILELPIEPERNGMQTVMRVKTNIKLQPEIIRCKECLMHGVCRFEQGLGLDGYCSHAERRTDG